jgi:hypothetical protein
VGQQTIELDDVGGVGGNGSADRERHGCLIG